MTFALGLFCGNASSGQRRKAQMALGPEGTAGKRLRGKDGSRDDGRKRGENRAGQGGDVYVRTGKTLMIIMCL